MLCSTINEHHRRARGTPLAPLERWFFHRGNSVRRFGRFGPFEEMVHFPEELKVAGQVFTSAYVERDFRCWDG